MVGSANNQPLREVVAAGGAVPGPPGLSSRAILDPTICEVGNVMKLRMKLAMAMAMAMMMIPSLNVDEKEMSGRLLMKDDVETKF